MSKCSVRDAVHNYLKNPELENDNLIAALEKLREPWLRNRQQECDPNWKQNLAFYSGNHYVRDSGRRTGQYRVRLRENHTNNIVNRIDSIIVQNMPITRVFPGSDEWKDIQDAEACENWIKYFHRTKHLELQYVKLVKYSNIFGNGFIFRGWNPHAGGNMYVTEAETGKKPGMRKWRGDPTVQVEDPFKYCFRPGMEELSEMYDFFRSVPTNKHGFEAEYGPTDADPVKALNAYNGQVREDDDQIQVHHYYHKPMNWWDEGVYVCYAGKKIAKCVSFPYNAGKLPVEHLPFDKAPMKFWAMSSIDQIIDLQEQLNRAASMIVENRNLMARPRWLVHESAKVPGQAISDIPGSKIVWSGNVKPEPSIPNFNFAEFSAHKGDVRNAMQLVSGMSGASRGEIPAATKTALALQLVLEQDRSQWTPLIKSFYACVNNTSLGVLELAAQYIPESDPRKFKLEQNNVAGESTFHGGMVPSPADVWLEDTNPLGWTASGRIEAVMGLVDKGLVTDPNRALEMIKLSNPDPAYRAESQSRQTAKKENDLLNQGIMVEVESEDIDPIHLDEHTAEMQSFGYKNKPAAVKSVFEAHVASHKERMGGGAPPGGGAPAPKGPAGALEGVQSATELPMPGQQMNELIQSARSG